MDRRPKRVVRLAGGRGGRISPSKSSGTTTETIRRTRRLGFPYNQPPLIRTHDKTKKNYVFRNTVIPAQRYTAKSKRYFNEYSRFVFNSNLNDLYTARYRRHYYLKTAGVFRLLRESYPAPWSYSGEKPHRRAGREIIICIVILGDYR